MTDSHLPSFARSGTSRVRSALRNRSVRAWALLVALATASCTTAEPKVGSIGAVLSRDRYDGAVHVREAPDGLAGSTAGLLAGDRVKMIDGILTDELEASEIKRLLRGTIGSNVVLTVLRAEAVLEITVRREPLGQGGTLPARTERIDP